MYFSKYICPLANTCILYTYAPFVQETCIKVWKHIITIKVTNNCKMFNYIQTDFIFRKREPNYYSYYLNGNTNIFQWFIFSIKRSIKKKKEISTFSTHNNSVSFVNRLIGYMVQFTKCRTEKLHDLGVWIYIYFCYL